MSVGSRIYARLGGAIPLCALFVATTALFATAPKHDDFWWADGPTHAMNGALLHDYLAAFDFTSPLKFATDYYLHYPALTVTLYPPLFPIAEATMFALFGVSHFAAQLTVSLLTLLFAYSMYCAFRTAFPQSAAGAGAALLALSAPAVDLWSQQVMLELPSLALLVGAAALFLRYLAKGASWRLYLSVLLLCGAVNTKQTAGFAVVAFAISLFEAKGWAVLRQPCVYYAAGLGVVLVMPLVVFTIVFAPNILDLAAGIGPEHGPNFAVASLWYARALPEIVGPIPLAAALGYLAVVSRKGWANQQERRLAVLMIAWFIADYLFISPIPHREVRYGIFLVVPVAILAMALIMRVLPQTLAAGGSFILGALAFVVTTTVEPVPRVVGYDAIAAYILHHADNGSVVLFHGLRSPNLVFALRAESPSPQLYLLRAEKLLVDYKIVREWGIDDRRLSRTDLEKLIDRYGITYAVFQPDFWTDLPSIAALQDLVYSDRFTKVAEFPIDANVPVTDKKILIFKNNRPTHPTHPDIELNMPLLRGKISATY
jgi:4-amino-4-deoxy-L-arabinose transferase-like glycosyltransferase